jgi:hypothetical protein
MRKRFICVQARILNLMNRRLAQPWVYRIACYARAGYGFKKTPERVQTRIQLVITNERVVRVRGICLA